MASNLFDESFISLKCIPTLCTAQYTDYLTDHPEIKQLIADYVMTLLVVKPDDVIEFTIQYFKGFVSEPRSKDTTNRPEAF
ncbi:ciliogenesis-associated TTC17-interacting protein-like [Pseudomyrmex gracilis]|uniref:ciliogenesis-associated TTC17-interacting protein-like n=1 Tax=Pseudomyrmex gracilis TaxID=219809 RepID=UPI0009957693|nr:ciliogenesis-associated TTC17-interacting protein-like [Pseudomyrmex gracilis]